VPMGVEPGRVESDEKSAVRQRSIGTPESIATTATSSEVGGELRQLQRSAGNRATTRLIDSHRSQTDRQGASLSIGVQRDDPVTMPAESITGSRGAATVAELRAMDEKAVDAELKKTSHDDRIKVATAIYATLVAPGTQSAIMMQTFQKVDSEALRIGLLNANYDRSYREGNWHDIIMYLNGYDDLGIAEHVAKWQTSELTEGIFQAR
jgi:hypothetical protein